MLVASLWRKHCSMDTKHERVYKLATFQRELEETLGKKLQLKVNNNRSTMLSVRWDPDCTKVSMHHMFLDAPQNIMQALACYIRQEDKVINPKVRIYIDENVKKLDYSHQLDKTKLNIYGEVYNLKMIYDHLNRQYFDKKLDLHITWFGKHNQRNRSQVTFGLYHDSMKLIKINRLLDSKIFPDYLISYVVYHEMLHNICPSYYDEKGAHHVHSKEFKKMEKEFEHYDRAQQWINKYRVHWDNGWT